MVARQAFSLALPGRHSLSLATSPDCGGLAHELVSSISLELGRAERLPSWARRSSRSQFACRWDQNATAMNQGRKECTFLLLCLFQNAANSPSQHPSESRSRMKGK